MCTDLNLKLLNPPSNQTLNPQSPNPKPRQPRQADPASLARVCHFLSAMYESDVAQQSQQPSGNSGNSRRLGPLPGQWFIGMVERVESQLHAYEPPDLLALQVRVWVQKCGKECGQAGVSCIRTSSTCSKITCANA